MRISMRKQRRAAGRPGALPNLRRICGHKAGAPTPQKGYAVDVLDSLVETLLHVSSMY